MTLSRFNPNPIQWYEGMFLVPQHFQQADLRQYHLWRYHLTYLTPYHWGVASLVIDTARLINGFFRIVSMEALLPDGTIVFFPESAADNLELDLTTVSTIKDGQPFVIYLTLPEEPVPGFESSALTRYVSTESQPVQDMNTGESATSITRLKPQVSLAVDSLPSRSIGVALCEVVRGGNKFTQTSFVPAQMRVTLDSPLGIACVNLTKRIRDKLAYLQNKIHNTLSADTYETTASMTSGLEKIRQHLVVGLLGFEAVLSTGMSHPYDVFKALSSLVSHFLAVRQGQYPPLFSPYDHNHLSQCFGELFETTDEILSNIEESYVAIAMVQKDRVYSLDLRTEWLVGDGRLILGAQAPAGVSEDTIMRWIQDAVIATDHFVNFAQETRVLGADRTILTAVPELKLAPPRGVVLFAVSKDPLYIASGDCLRLFNISDTQSTRPQQIMLYLDNSESMA